MPFTIRTEQMQAFDEAGIDPDFYVRRERAEDVPELVRHFLIQAQAEGLPSKSLDWEHIAWFG